MKLYGHPISTCTRKVLATLAEKGEKPEFIVVDLSKGEHKQPPHLARQPFGQIPAIDDDGFELYESRAIIRYIDETRPQNPLTPKDARGRAVMEQWISIETSNVTPHIMGIVWEQLFKKMMFNAEGDAEKVAKSREALLGPLRIMDEHLAKSPYVAGETYTLADLGFQPYFEYLLVTPSADVIDGYPHVKAWWEKIRARPSWQAAIGASAAK